MRPKKSTTEAAPQSRLWLWVLAACVVQVAVWTAWLIFAGHHPVAEVPLVSGDKR